MNLNSQPCEPVSPALPKSFRDGAVRKSSGAQSKLTSRRFIAGARARALAVRESLAAESSFADYYVGLEGGFHTRLIEKTEHTFLRGWVCVTDGERESFGSTSSIGVPTYFARRVIDEGRELGSVIDEITVEKDVRSRQGTWGVLSLDLITRSASFEVAVIAAFALFYNIGFGSPPS